MQHLDFPAKYLDVLKKIIREQIPDAEIWAFGSRVNKQNHETSDLDLVIHQKNTASDAFIKFKESILNSNIPILIDVLDWDSIPDSFKDEIQKNHVVVYKPTNKQLSISKNL
jgi:predicted nucleotidyltransferase